MRMALHDRLSEAVQKWRAEGYPASYPVREILAYAHTDKETLRYLRQPQFEALETYWYLRLVLKTPRLSALYDALFENRADKLDALGISITHSEVARALANSEDLVQKILTDDAFAKALSADALRESLSLAYPSYIFALTMGAGKTALIGAIIATEFALALQYQGGPFMKNALVFAPGKTILDSLRQIATLPFEDIIPPRFLSEFLPNVKLIYTTDGDPDIPVVEGGSFNIVVTNSEKITLRKMNKRTGQAPSSAALARPSTISQMKRISSASSTRPARRITSGNFSATSSAGTGSPRASATTFSKASRTVLLPTIFPNNQKMK